MIVFPMVGKSSRFFDAGYTVPKFMLETPKGNVFRQAVSSFSKYFDTDDFIFVTRTDHDAENWVAGQLESLSVKSFRIVSLDDETLGQADSVRQGLTNIPDTGEPLTIFNIDTFRPGFIFPTLPLLGSNWLEVFKGEGDHWSFVEPGPDCTVRRTTEKERISQLCSNGLYGFSSQSEFMELVERAIKERNFVKGEIYVAPLYNDLIQRDTQVYYREVPIGDIVFCGTPDEYSSVLKTQGI